MGFAVLGGLFEATRCDDGTALEANATEGFYRCSKRRPAVWRDNKVLRLSTSPILYVIM